MTDEQLTPVGELRDEIYAMECDVTALERVSERLAKSCSDIRAGIDARAADSGYVCVHCGRPIVEDDTECNNCGAFKPFLDPDSFIKRKEHHGG